MPLAGIVTGELSWRRLRDLVRALPASSQLARAQAGHVVWSDTEHLLAGIFDLLAAANWQRGNGKGDRPRPLKRPQKDARVGKPIPIEEARKRRARTLGRAS